MENKPDYSKMMESLFEPTGLNDEKPSEELAKSVIDSSMLGLIGSIYKKTMGYELEKVIPGKNPGDECIRVHSDAWIDKHPKRRNNPEYTKEEIERDNAWFDQQRNRKEYERIRNEIESKQ